MKAFGFELDPFQEQAIQALKRGENVLVCAPTGTGKTLVADWMVDQAIKDGGEVVYTAPIKALSNQKYRDYIKLLGEDQVGLVTGDLVIRRDAPCRVMTTEILRNMLLGGERLEHLRAVIIDEIHFLDDKERGTVWEEVLIYLPPHVRIVGLSATVSNLNDFSAWLREVRGQELSVIVEEKRAVPLETVIVTRKGGILSPEAMARHSKRHARSGNQQQNQRSRSNRRGRARDDRPFVAKPTRHTDVYGHLAPKHLPYLYFVFSRRNAESFAKALARHVGHTILSASEREKLEDKLAAFVEDNGDAALDDGLRHLYGMGIAFHHAGLHVQLKTLVEELYEARLIKILYCTSTFALGINMPARAAVFDSLKRYDGKQMIFLPTREFMQMAGRAGRRGLDDFGMVAIRADPEEYATMKPLIERHLRGRYEPVRSSFSLSFNSVVNLLHRHPEDKIREIVEKSFLSFFRSRKTGRLADEQAELRQQLADQGWTEGDPIFPEVRSKAKKLRKLSNRLKAGTTQTWQEFQEKVTFLQHWGYLDEDGTFGAGGKALLHLQIQEVFVAEVFLAGLFEHLDGPTFFGVLCGMCMEFPRSAHPQKSKHNRSLCRSITRIRHSDIVVAAEQMTQVQVVWDPNMVAFGSAWADGMALEDLMQKVHSQTDLSGDLVSAFRRGKDLAKQLRGLWLEDEAKQQMISGILKAVSRDEVEVVA